MSVTQVIEKELKEEGNEIQELLEFIDSPFKWVRKMFKIDDKSLENRREEMRKW